MLSPKLLCKSVYNTLGFQSSSLVHTDLSHHRPASRQWSSPSHSESLPWHQQVVCSHGWENTCPSSVWTFHSSEGACGGINSSGGPIKGCRAVSNTVWTVRSLRQIYVFISSVCPAFIIFPSWSSWWIWKGEALLSHFVNWHSPVHWDSLQISVQMNPTA